MVSIELPANNTKEREYVCRYVFEERLGMRCEFHASSKPHTVITGPGGKILVIPDVLFAVSDGAYLSTTSLPRTPLMLLPTDVLHRGEPDRPSNIAALYATEGASTAATIDEKSVRLSFDALGAIFFMLSRMEEVLESERDRHERFPTNASWTVRNGVELRPIVDEAIGLLHACANSLWPGSSKPCGSYEVAPSHDIDHPFLYHGLRPVALIQRFGRKVGGDLLTRRSLSEAARTAVSCLRFLRSGPHADPYFTFRELMDRSERLGLRSTFYLIAGAELPIDGRAYLHDSAIAEIVRELVDRGHHVGLHASYQTLRDASRALEEVKKLHGFLERIGIDIPPLGVRHHYLRWSARDHWSMWEAAGVVHDATLGFGDRVGFRCGTSHTYPVFDLQTRRALQLRERPLLVMDSAICPDRPPSAPRARRRALEILQTLADRCRCYGGVMELLWHNTHLQSRAQSAMYAEVLDICISARPRYS